MKRSAVSIMVLLLLIAASGCATSLTNNRRLNMEPLFNYDRDIDKESTEFNAFGPFFTLKSKPKEKEYGFRPLFYVREKEGEYSKYFALWPIFFFEKTDLDTDNPRTFKAVFPLFVDSSSPEKDSTTFLWPFFSYTNDKKNNYKQWDMPWPIFHYGKGKEIESFRLFPIYGYKTKPDSKTRFFLWPLYTYDKEIFEDHEDTTHRFLLINKYQRKVWKGKFKDAKSVRIWPLFYYNRKQDGAIKFSFPELIPIEDEGFERNWAPLFRLYQYNKDAEGNMESKFLWGLYRHKKMESKELFELTFLFSYEKEKDRVCLSILKGLFEYRREKDANSIKLFYLPQLIRWEFGNQNQKQSEFTASRRLGDSWVYEGIEQG